MTSKFSLNDLAIISGGSSGIDTAALLAGNELGIKTIGSVHANCLVKSMYHGALTVKSHTEKDIYNVDICDGVIAFRFNVPNTGKGTDQTINYAKCGSYKHVVLKKEADLQEIKGNKNSLVVWDYGMSDNLEAIIAKHICEFIIKYNIRFIMISGQTQKTLDELKLDINIFKNLLVKSINLVMRHAEEYKDTF